MKCRGSTEKEEVYYLNKVGVDVVTVRDLVEQRHLDAGVVVCGCPLRRACVKEIQSAHDVTKLVFDDGEKKRKEGKYVLAFHSHRNC